MNSDIKRIFNDFCYKGHLDNLIDLYNNNDFSDIFSNHSIIEDSINSACFSGHFHIVQQLYVWFPDFIFYNFNKTIFTC